MTLSADVGNRDPTLRRLDHLLVEEGDVAIGAVFSFVGRPGGVAVGSDGSIWVSDLSAAMIWHVTEDGRAAALAVTPTGGEGDWESTSRLFGPAGLAFGPDGSLFAADSAHDRISALAPDGSLRVVAGGANGYRDGPASEAMFRRPLGVAVAADGTCFVADTGNDRIRRIAPDGIVTTVAGSIYDYGDGQGAHARFRRPAALDVGADGMLYVADTGNNSLRVITPDGGVTTLAGEPTGGDSDGIGPGIRLRGPTGIAVGHDGVVWVVDHDNGVLRRIDTEGEGETRLRLSGRRWPVAVALRGDGAPVLAIAALYDERAPEACLTVLEV